MTLVDVLFKAGAVVILVNNTNLGSGIPSLLLLNFSDAAGTQLENNTRICLRPHLDLDGLLSSYYSLPAEYNGHHVGVSVLPVQRLGGEQKAGVAEEESLPGLVVGDQVFGEGARPLVLVEEAQVGDQGSWRQAGDE